MLRRIASLSIDFLHCFIVVWILLIFCGDLEFIPPLNSPQNLVDYFCRYMSYFNQFTYFAVDSFIASCFTHDPFIIYYAFIVLKRFPGKICMYFHRKSNCFIAISISTIIVITIILFNIIHWQSRKQNNLWFL